MTQAHTQPQVHVEVRSDRVAVVTLDDPGRRNALSLQLCEDLVLALDNLGSDPDVGAIVVTGAGPAFCAGADLTQLGDSSGDGLKLIYEGFMAVARCPIPTVAAVNGPAVGAGMNLALAADLRIMGPRGRFDCRFLKLGIHPGGGHTWMLRRIVGPQVASAMVLFGEVLDAAASVQRGLAWEATDAEGLLARAAELAGAAASVPEELSRSTKATLADMATVGEHDEAVELELERQLVSMESPAFAERLAALKSSVSSGG